MAKNVTREIHRRDLAVAKRMVARDSSTGVFSQGYKKSFSKDERVEVDTERRAMRERLLADG